MNRNSEQARGLLAWFPLSAWWGSKAGHSYVGDGRFRWNWNPGWTNMAYDWGTSEIGRWLRPYSTGVPSGSPDRYPVDWGTMPELQGTDQLTLSYWVKRVASKVILIGQQPPDSKHTIALEVYIDGYAHLGIGDEVGFQSGRFAMPLGWHLLTGVFNGNLTGNAERAKIYLDGKQVTLDFQSFTIPSVTSTANEIHGINVSETFSNADGYFTDIRYYNHAITAQNAFNLWNPSTRWELYEPTRPRIWPSVKLEETPVEAPVFQLPVPKTSKSSAVRINASGEILQRTTSLPLSTSFTMCGWAKLTMRPSSWQYWGIENGLSNGDTYINLGYNVSNEFKLSVTGLAGDFDSYPPDGTWIFWAMTNAGTGTSDCNGYWAKAGETFEVASTTGLNFTVAHFSIGNNSWNEYMNGAFAFTKVYNVPLSAAELYREMYSKEPVKTAGLNLWSPHYAGNIERARDYSGHGRHFTEGGTLTDEPGPDIKWDEIKPIFFGYSTEEDIEEVIFSWHEIYKPRSQNIPVHQLNL